MNTNKCQYCGCDFSSSLERCPHCCRPSLFPNVIAPSDPVEHDSLIIRYDSAIADTTSRGCNDIIRDFEAAVKKSEAVIARPLEELERIATNDSELYATYYKLIEGGVRIPKGDKWDKLRAIVDELLFSSNKRQIIFAALSLNKLGLSNYGECSLVLKEDMIAHRASVFEENSVMFMKHHGINAYNNYKLPTGYKAVWDEREKICVAKLFGKVIKSTTADDYCELILKQGTSSDNDDFIEVHIWGTMTIRTIKHVVIKSKKKMQRTRYKALKEKLGNVGVSLEVC